MIEELRNRHAGETCWIVGKGPSLEFLRSEHFGAGPVITINEAILIVQDLNLPNPLYAMNKDGCRNERKGHACTMIHPRSSVTMILQALGFSQHCFPGHLRRVLVNPVDELGFQQPSVMSIRMCIAIARVMGCVRLMIVCCDSLVNGDLHIWDGIERRPSGASGHYSAVIPLVKAELADMPHEYILPQKRKHG